MAAPTGYVFCQYDYSEATVERRTFAATDKQGRVIGALVKQYVVTVTERNVEGQQSGMVVKPEGLGVWFVFRPHTTRNGERFGATQQERQYRTEAERDAAVADYFKKAEARALKGK